MRKKILLTSILIILASGCSSLAGMSNEQIKKEQPVLAQINEDKDTKIQEGKDERVDIQLYFGDSQSAMLKKEKRQVSLKEVLKDSPRVIILELMKGPSEKELFPVVPSGTKLLSIEKKEDTVTVNFSKEFRDNHNGGSAGETITLYSIVNSLTEIKDVEKVQFLIEGKIEKEFKGHYEFDKPFIRNESLTVQ
ncbi:MAG: GerMN domain-containing protein [Deltaproteobacteria bacterium]